MAVPVVLSRPSRNVLATNRSVSSGFRFSSATMEASSFSFSSVTYVRQSIRIDGRNEPVDQLFLAAQLGTRPNDTVNHADDALIRAVRRVVLLHEHEDVVDVNVHLTDELQLEHDIVVDVLLLGIPLPRQQTVYIEIDALVVLQITRRIRRLCQITECDNIAKRLDRVQNPIRA